MSISTIIHTIKKRPGMYLGSNSITALNHFLNGYQAAERDLAISANPQLFPLPFRYMSEFTKIRLQAHSNLGWGHHILNFCNGDEQQALNMFFELYDEFEQIRMKRCLKAVLTKNNIEYNNSIEHGYSVIKNEKFPVFSNPIAIYIMELTVSAFILVVEASDEIRIDPQFFTSLEDAKGNPLGAQHYLGEIKNWKEVLETDCNFACNIL
ncbi:MAG: hypothetical protein J6D02_02590 [Lachnospira sp.]|nr:hypothetical protein [Lachnospira sp.]